jgi:hypothetical protein
MVKRKTRSCREMNPSQVTLQTDLSPMSNTYQSVGKFITHHLYRELSSGLVVANMCVFVASMKCKKPVQISNSYMEWPMVNVKNYHFYNTTTNFTKCIRRVCSPSSLINASITAGVYEETTRFSTPIPDQTTDISMKAL